MKCNMKKAQRQKNATKKSDNSDIWEKSALE